MPEPVVRRFDTAPSGRTIQFVPDDTPGQVEAMANTTLVSVSVPAH